MENGICLKCGNEFEKHKSFQKFCSDRCRSTYHARRYEQTEEGKFKVKLRNIKRLERIDRMEKERIEMLKKEGKRI